jgi:hypothetical protein
MTREQWLPDEVLLRLPALYATEADEDQVAQVKFFYPDAAWTRYGIEFDGDDLFFGLVDGFEKELGYFRLSELMATRGKLGCAIERDFYFRPTPVRELLAQ